MKKLLSVIIITVLCSVTSFAQLKQCAGPSGGLFSTFLAKDGSLFTGGRFTGAYRSDDNGDSWKSVNSGLPAQAYVLSYRAIGSKIIIGLGPGIYKSNDNGNTWTEIKCVLSDKVVSCFAGTDSMLFAGTWTGMYRSTDGGETWTEANLNLNIQSLEWFNGEIYAGVQEKGLFRSIDNGNVWSLLGKDEFKSAVTAIKVINSPVGKIIYAASKDLCRSTDNGVRWERVYAKEGVSVTEFAAIGETLFAGIGNGIYSSTDYGGRWDNITPSKEFSGVTVLGTKGNTLYGIGDGVVRSSDKGGHWQEKSKGLRNYTVNSFGKLGNILFANTNAGGLYQSTDQGDNWTKVYFSDTRKDALCLPVNDTLMFLGGFSEEFYRTSDKGKTWKTMYLPNVIGYLEHLVAVGNTLVALGSYSIATSTDEGLSWTKVGSTFSMNVDQVTVVDTTIFIVSGYKGVLKSTDKGATWEKSLGDFNNLYFATITHVGNVLFAGISSGFDVPVNTPEIFRSTDTGKTWVGTKYKGVVTTFAVSGKQLFAASSASGLFMTNDNGETWTKLDVQLPRIMGVILTVVGNSLYAGFDYAGIWKMKVDFTGVSDEEKLQKVTTSSIFCYPNPATNTLTIDRTTLQLPENAPVHYTLSTLVGGKVIEFDNSEPKFTVQLEGIANGVYSLTAESGANRAAVMVTVVE